ncbi:ParB/RepB/Spo0J family partition protein [Candidatus Dojkabacteria bacterium]|uniref:ParB/RepB/Spo0J family partition protein n=1 Tax=Candidatus Dojkabacteria bacterium TaxID=2099670 RepID=A0A955RI40_9BACT|nr:ParB/RepB/Spo0J family partition protein [Candidatus Dojkabacteria bacterium]
MSIYKLAADYPYNTNPDDTKAKKSKADPHEGYEPNMPVERIVPNRYQPRTSWNPEKLMELAESIRENGIIEPLIVSQAGDNKYEIIAGERRFRASKMAGLKHVPVIIKETSPQQLLELAVIENVQRADLNPLEEAVAFAQLSTEFGLTHEQIAVKIGYSRPAVANKIRLLQLPDEVKNAVLEGKISEGHARAILGLSDTSAMISLYQKIVKSNMSVRETEEMVRKLNLGMKSKQNEARKAFAEREKELNNQIENVIKDTKFKIKKTKNKVKLELDFKNEAELNNFLNKLK